MNRLFYAAISSIVLVVFIVDVTHQHGYLIDPPARSSAWLVDREFYNCCINYQHNQMFCGGVKKLWYENGGRCGICGEAWDEPKVFEKSGSKYLGKVLRRYTAGSVITVEVYITANHKGFFEFRLCDVDGWVTDATQECLNSTLLRLADDPESTKFKILPYYSRVSYKLQLPDNLTCDHCVMQWKWVTGNSWGHDDALNVSCVGCGVIQEQFFGCADVSIKEKRHLVEQSTTTLETSTSVSTTTVSTDHSDHTEYIETTSSPSESTTIISPTESSISTIITITGTTTINISTEIVNNYENTTAVTAEPTTTISTDTTSFIFHSASSTTSTTTDSTTIITSSSTTVTITTTTSTTTTATTTTTTTSTKPTTTTSRITSANRPLTSTTQARHDCESKLEFGTLSDVSDEIKVFCNEMCNNKCKQLIAEFKENLYKNTALRRPNTDLMACLETCPVLCSCYKH